MKKTKNTKTPGFAIRIPGGPIDWDAWVAEASQPRGNKGKKRDPALAERCRQAQLERHRRKRLQLAEALAAMPKPEPPRDPWAYVTVTERLLGSMQPGSWYATVDMARVAPAVKYQACKAFAVTWWREGILERRQNPDWKPPERVGGKQEPKWLYRLTPEGERRHRAAAWLL